MFKTAKTDAQLVHDMNNYLATILAECDVLERLLSNLPGASERVTIIRLSAKEMASERVSLSWPATPGVDSGKG